MNTRKIASVATGRPCISFLHIGKTGGSSLHDTLRVSYKKKPWLLLQHKAFFQMHTHHTKISDIPKRNLIAFGIRNPIDLLNSAFYNYHPNYNNDYNITLPPEALLFYKSFPTFKDWAIALLNRRKLASYAFEFNMHMNRRLEYYLKDPVNIDKCKDRIVLIYTSKEYEEDIRKFCLAYGLKYPNQRKNPSHKPTTNGLTDDELRHLRSYFKNDFECFEHCIQIRAELENKHYALL